MEKETQIEGGMAKLSDDERQEVFEQIHKKVLADLGKMDQTKKKATSEDLSNMLSDLLILEKHATKLYAYYRSVNQDKFSSGDMDLSKLQ